jgi:excisionase family DNA binding protein
MKPRPNSRLISLANAARELGLPYHTLYELIQRGSMPIVRLPGMRSIYFDRRDLDSAIESWKDAAR